MDQYDAKALDVWLEDGGRGDASDEHRTTEVVPMKTTAKSSGIHAFHAAPNQWSFDDKRGVLTIFGLSALRLGKRWGVGRYLSDGVTSCVCEYSPLGTAARFDIMGRAAVTMMPCADISVIMPARLALELWLDERLIVSDLRSAWQVPGKIVIASLRVGGMDRPAIIVDERTHPEQSDFSFIADPAVVAAVRG